MVGFDPKKTSYRALKMALSATSNMDTSLIQTLCLAQLMSILDLSLIVALSNIHIHVGAH